MAASSWQAQFRLVGLVLGLMGSCEVLLAARGIPAGPPPYLEAKHCQSEVRVIETPTQVLTITLREGEKRDVPGTALTVAVRTVRDFTSEGCLGGPMGCPDHVELEVIRGQESQRIVLYVAHTQARREQGIFQASVLGYNMALTALRDQQLTLSVTKDR